MIGLDFRQTRNRVMGKLVNQTAAMVAVQMMHVHRIISLYTFTNSTVIRLAPPLNVEREDLEKYLDALEHILATNRPFARLAYSTGRLIRSA